MTIRVTQPPAPGTVTPIMIAGGYLAVTADYTATLNDDHLEVTLNAPTITLPAAATSAGKEYVIKVSGSGTGVTIDPNGAELIGGGATLVLGGKGLIRCRCTGTGWSVTEGRYYGVAASVGEVLYLWDHAQLRWQLTYGDTGWRSVTPLAITNVIQDGLWIRRQGYVCSLLYNCHTTSTPIAEADLYQLPAGFLGSSAFDEIWTGARPGVVGDVGNVAAVRRVASGSMLKATIKNSGATIWTPATWMTTDAWPTSLPGSASGSIPNT